MLEKERLLAAMLSAEQIEDKGRLGDGLVDVAQLVGGGLHAVAVVVDCGVPLS